MTSPRGDSPDGAPAREGELCLTLGDARPMGLMQGYEDEAGGVTG